MPAYDCVAASVSTTEILSYTPACAGVRGRRDTGCASLLLCQLASYEPNTAPEWAYRLCNHLHMACAGRVQRPGGELNSALRPCSEALAFHMAVCCFLYLCVPQNVLGMFSGLAASIGSAASSTSAGVAAERAAASATVAGAATSVSSAAAAATAVASGVAVVWPHSLVQHAARAPHVLLASSKFMCSPSIKANKCGCCAQSAVRSAQYLHLLARSLCLKGLYGFYKGGDGLT